MDCNGSSIIGGRPAPRHCRCRFALQDSKGCSLIKPFNSFSSMPNIFSSSSAVFINASLAFPTLSECFAEVVSLRGCLTFRRALQRRSSGWLAESACHTYANVIGIVLIFGTSSPPVRAVRREDSGVSNPSGLRSLVESVYRTLLTTLMVKVPAQHGVGSTREALRGGFGLGQRYFRASKGMPMRCTATKNGATNDVGSAITTCADCDVTRRRVENNIHYAAFRRYPKSNIFLQIVWVWGSS